LIENTFDRKRIYANPSAFPNPNSNSNPNTNPNSNPNLNPNPKAQLCFWSDEMTSFFDQVYRYRLTDLLSSQQALVNLFIFHLFYTTYLITGTSTSATQ